MAGSGYVSKRNIIRWLEHYESLAAGSPIDDGLVVNSGPKAYDGVSGGKLNKIMLDEALGKLRLSKPASYRVIDAVYLRPILRREGQAMLGHKAYVFNRLKREGVDFLYFAVNGAGANYKLLAKAVDKAAERDRRENDKT